MSSFHSRAESPARLSYWGNARVGERLTKLRRRKITETKDAEIILEAQMVEVNEVKKSQGSEEKLQEAVSSLYEILVCEIVC